jgi:hypothetical protein
MRMTAILLACLAVAIGACGRKDAGGGAVAARGAADISAPSPLDRPFALKGAEEIDVDELLSLVPEPARPTYVKATFDRRLGATVVTGLTFADRTPGDDENDGFTIERAELYGVDMEAIARVKAVENPAVDAPFEKLFERVRLFGVKPADAAAGASIGAVEMDQFRLRRGGFVPNEEENLAIFFNAFEYAGLYFKDFSAAEKVGEDGAFALKVPDIRIVGVGGGKLGALLARDVAYELDRPASADALMDNAAGGPFGTMITGPLKGMVAPDKQRVTIKSFEWRAVDLSGLMAYGVKKERPPMSARDLIDLGSIKALGATTYINGRKAMSADEVSVPVMDFVWLAPAKIRSQTKGLAYDFTAYAGAGETKLLDVLKAHGLGDVKASADFAWDWDPNRGGATLKSAFLSDKLADFKLDAAISGWDLKKMSAAQAANESDIFAKFARLDSFAMTLTDKKLLDAVFDISAIEMGGTGAELRKNAPAMVRLSGAAFAVANPRLADYVDAVADFVGEGGSLEISANPAAPVPLAAMAGDPEQLPEVLNLQVVHKPKQGAK